MKTTCYQTIPKMLDRLPESNRSACLRLYTDNKARFIAAPGSSSNHQAWPGGYHDHVAEIMNLVIIFYHLLNSLRPLEFALKDAILAAFFHDMEKPWKYVPDPGAPPLTDKTDRHRFRLVIAERYGVIITPDVEAGIRYAEGEPASEYSSKRRVMPPIAALVHMADVWSARGWYNYPHADADLWPGAKRER